jgi:hypothetical protein
MPYKNRDEIVIPPETKTEVREAKEELGISYREFLERAANELTEA